MKNILSLLMLFGLITACGKTHPVDIKVERDGVQINVVAEHTETTGNLQNTIIESMKLTIGEDGIVRNDEGNEWDSVDEAIEAAIPMVEASLEATLRGLKTNSK